MSVRAIAWAASQDLPPGIRWTLYWLADQADDAGRGAWPSKRTLARKCHTDEKVIQKQLRTLEVGGYIVPGDQRHTAHYPANRRPTVWNLNLWRGMSGDLVLQKPLPAALGEPQDPPGLGEPQNPSGPLGGSSGSLQGGPQDPQTKNLTLGSDYLPAQGDGSTRERARGAATDPVPPERAQAHIASIRAAIRKNGDSR